MVSQNLNVQSVEKLSRMVNADSLEHSYVREKGGENICHTTWQKLQLKKLLFADGFNGDEAALAATQKSESDFFEPD